MTHIYKTTLIDIYRTFHLKAAEYTCFSMFNSVISWTLTSPDPLPLLSPRTCSDLYPLSQWCYLAISSPAAPFSFCLQSFPASGSFPMSWLFASGGQSVGASASATVLLVNIQDLISFRFDSFDLAVHRTLKSVLQKSHKKSEINYKEKPKKHKHMDYWINERENIKKIPIKIKWKRMTPNLWDTAKSVLRGKFIAM